MHKFSTAAFFDSYYDFERYMPQSQPLDKHSQLHNRHLNIEPACLRHVNRTGRCQILNFDLRSILHNRITVSPHNCITVSP